MQVAGRAGRAELKGEVLIQTQYPDHPLFAAVVAHDYPGFAAEQLKEREQAGFPPYAFQAMLRAEAPQMADAIAFLKAAAALPEVAEHGNVLDLRPGADAHGPPGQPGARPVAGRIAVAPRLAGLPAAVAGGHRGPQGTVQAALAHRGRSAGVLSAGCSGAQELAGAGCAIADSSTLSTRFLSMSMTSKRHPAASK